MVLNEGGSALRGHLATLESFLIITAGWAVLLALGGERHDRKRAQDNSPTKTIQLQMAIVLRLRNPDIVNSLPRQD